MSDIPFDDKLYGHPGESKVNNKGFMKKVDLNRGRISGGRGNVLSQNSPLAVDAPGHGSR